MRRFIELIGNKAPFQKKRIDRFLSEYGDGVYWKEANEFAEKLLYYMNLHYLSLEDVANAYIKMCKEMLCEQIQFNKIGEYSCKSVETAYQNIYSNKVIMQNYMLGLGLSLFLWKNHYFMYQFFIETINDLTFNAEGRYLEIGAGHGMYTSKVLSQKKFGMHKIIDFSPTAIDICKDMIQSQDIVSSRSVEFDVQDALTMNTLDPYDFITMGEVIEHTANPQQLLENVSELLKRDGILFITTCANCPAADHIYLFRNVDEIRSLLTEYFDITEELVLPVDNDKEMINYAAVVRKIG